VPRGRADRGLRRRNFSMASCVFSQMQSLPPNWASGGRTARVRFLNGIVDLRLQGQVDGVQIFACTDGPQADEDGLDTPGALDAFLTSRTRVHQGNKDAVCGSEKRLPRSSSDRLSQDFRRRGSCARLRAGLSGTTP